MTDVPQGCADDCCAYAEPPHNRAERPLGATKPPNPSPGSDNGSRGSQDENCDHLSHGWSLAEVVAPGYSLGDVPVCNGCGQVWWP